MDRRRLLACIGLAPLALVLKTKAAPDVKLDSGYLYGSSAGKVRWSTASDYVSQGCEADRLRYGR